MSDAPEDIMKIVTTLTMFLMALFLLSKIMDLVIDGVPTDEDAQYFNFTVISKRIEINRGLFNKRSYVLILSDGEKYKVLRDIFERYETGDPISIEIRKGKVVFS